MDVKIEEKVFSDHHVHLLTKEDAEDVLIAIDTLYWRVLRLITKRSIDVAHDPYDLARSMKREWKDD